MKLNPEEAIGRKIHATLSLLPLCTDARREFAVLWMGQGTNDGSRMMGDHPARFYEGLGLPCRPTHLPAVPRQVQMKSRPSSSEQ